MNSAATQRKTENVKGKERVRGPKLAILVKRANGVPFEEGLVRVDKGNGVFASNARLDEVLRSGEWRNISEVFACWSGTVTAYKKPGEKLGDYVIYTDPETKQRYIFPVNKEYRKEKDAILVTEHPDYDQKPCEKGVIESVQDIYQILLSKDINEKDLIVVAQDIKNVDLLSNFPSEDGWYLTDEKHGIPIGNKVDSSNSDARHLWRIEDDSRVGPVARGYDYYIDYYNGRDVDLSNRPSDGLGVAVEAPDANEQSSLRPLSEGQSGGNAPQKLQVEKSQDESGILVKGVTLDEFKALVGNAESTLNELLQTVREEKLEPLLKLVETLKIKE